MSGTASGLVLWACYLKHISTLLKPIVFEGERYRKRMGLKKNTPERN